MEKFQLRDTSSGVKFDLLAANGQVIFSSEVYRSRAAARKGIASIQAIAAAAGVENHTEEPRQVLPNPKFELYRDKAGNYRFRLKARNGKIVGVSGSYSQKTGALNGIESVRCNAGPADTDE